MASYPYRCALHSGTEKLDFLPESFDGLVQTLLCSNQPDDGLLILHRLIEHFEDRSLNGSGRSEYVLSLKVNIAHGISIKSNTTIRKPTSAQLMPSWILLRAAHLDSSHSRSIR